MTPLLDYISTDPRVQLVLILGLVFLIGINFVFANLRKVRKQEHDLTIVNPSKNVTQYRNDE